MPVDKKPEKLTPKKGLRAIAAALAQEPRDYLASPAKDRREQLLGQIQSQINACIQKAFRDNYIDPTGSDAWQRLATALSIIMYAGNLKDAGRPSTSKRSLTYLRKRIAALRKIDPSLSEKKCCEILIRLPPFKDMKGHATKDKQDNFLTAEGLRKRLYRK